MPKITLIGAGNMAWQLAKTCTALGWPIEEIYSRKLANAEWLAGEFAKAKPKSTNELDFSQSKATLFLLCVADQAMEEVVKQLVLPPNTLLAHTSGSQALTVLTQRFSTAGVLYPFQTVSKGKEIDLNKVPICVEASDYQTLELLKNIAQKLSTKVYVIDSASRKKLHLAAIFACNFVNHLLTMAQEILEDSSMEMGLVEHLVLETVEKAFDISPKQSQTGPAIRGDHNIISEHLSMLKGQEAKSEVYQLLSNSIEAMYTKKDK